MNVHLISPAYISGVEKGMKGKIFHLPPYSLMAVAAVTPTDVNVRIVDENIETVNFNADVDLVGITAMTTIAPRAYEVAKKFRARKVKVILGGIHPTALPGEAIKYADSVVIGEAENCWPKLMADFKKNRLKKFYCGKGRPDLSILPLPRRDVLNPGAYILTSTVQTTRGCPFSCSFCSVSKFFGKTYRTRPVPEIIREVRDVKSKFIGFLDDNIFGHPQYARKLFQALKNEKVIWMGQASLNITKNIELLKLAAQSGCKGLFIGLESISSPSLNEMNKKFLRPDDFKNQIKTLHEYGIGVLGAFIVGFDSDDESIFERTLEFAKKIDLDLAQFAILTPYPGTEVYNKLVRENRILTYNWQKYDAGNVVFKPLQIGVEKLKEKADWMWREFYRFDQVIYRLLNLGKRLPLSFLPLLIMNLSFKKQIKATQQLA